MSGLCRAGAGRRRDGGVQLLLVQHDSPEPCPGDPARHVVRHSYEATLRAFDAAPARVHRLAAQLGIELHRHPRQPQGRGAGLLLKRYVREPGHRLLRQVRCGRRTHLLHQLDRLQPDVVDLQGAAQEGERQRPRAEGGRSADPLASTRTTAVRKLPSPSIPTVRRSRSTYVYGRSAGTASATGASDGSTSTAAGPAARSRARRERTVESQSWTAWPRRRTTAKRTSTQATAIVGTIHNPPSTTPAAASASATSTSTSCRSWKGPTWLVWERARRLVVAGTRGAVTAAGDVGAGLVSGALRRCRREDREEPGAVRKSAHYARASPYPSPRCPLCPKWPFPHGQLTGRSPYLSSEA